MAKDLATSSHADLYMQREKTTDKAEQNRIAPYEHRAFAREATAENPLLAVPIALAAPIYQASKAIPGMESRSDASVEQLLQSWIGVAEGLQQTKVLQSILAALGK